MRLLVQRLVCGDTGFRSSRRNVVGACVARVGPLESVLQWYRGDFQELIKMARLSGVFRYAFVALILGFMTIAAMTVEVQAQAPAPAPTPTSDGHAIDQGIAYFLLLLALVLTYLIPMDAYPNFF